MSKILVIGGGAAGMAAAIFAARSGNEVHLYEKGNDYYLELVQQTSFDQYDQDTIIDLTFCLTDDAGNVITDYNDTIDIYIDGVRRFVDNGNSGPVRFLTLPVKQLKVQQRINIQKGSTIYVKSRDGAYTSNTITVDTIYDPVKIEVTIHDNNTSISLVGSYGWGTAFKTNNTSVYINWGDDYGFTELSPVNQTSSNYQHTYETSGTYTIQIYLLEEVQMSDGSLDIGFNKITYSSLITRIGKIYNIYRNTLGNHLSEVHIPKSVRSFSSGVFQFCTNLTKIYFNWTESNEIPYFSSFGELGNINVEIFVPEGTEELYKQKGYPIDFSLEEEYTYEYVGIQWRDNNNSNGNRPSSFVVPIILQDYATGENLGIYENVYLTEDNIMTEESLNEDYLSTTFQVGDWVVKVENLHTRANGKLGMWQVDYNTTLPSGYRYSGRGSSSHKKYITFTG